MKAYAPCLGCGTPLVPPKHPNPPQGTKRHHARGMCHRCHDRTPPTLRAVSDVDYGQAACLGYDPEEWSDNGTLRARRLCAGCPIRRGCLDDAVAQRARGVLRGGRVFPGFGSLGDRQRAAGSSRSPTRTTADSMKGET